MSGNSDGCRAYGLRCAQLAQQTKSPELRKELLLLAGQWFQLATFLEYRRVTLQASADTKPVQMRQGYALQVRTASQDGRLSLFQVERPPLPASHQAKPVYPPCAGDEIAPFHPSPSRYSMNERKSRPCLLRVMSGPCEQGR